MRASMFGKVERVRQLLEEGADVNQKDGDVSIFVRPKMPVYPLQLAKKGVCFKMLLPTLVPLSFLWFICSLVDVCVKKGNHKEDGR